MMRVASALALLIVPATLTAQRPQCSGRTADSAALSPADVDQLPVADSVNRSPIYSELVRQAGVGGEVRVAFIVDTAGVPERGTIKIVRTAHAGFDPSVKNTVGTWRFAPARLCGQPVRVRLSHEFEFRPTTRRADTLHLDWVFKDSIGAVPSPLTSDTLPDGTPHTIVGMRSPDWEQPVVFLEFATLGSAVRDSAEEAALSVLVGDIASDSLTRIVCIAGANGRVSDPDGRRLTRLTVPGVVVLASRRCPPTFASMMYRPGQRSSPPGEDPYHIRFVAKRALSPTRALFDIDIAQGTGGTRYRCGAERRDGQWRARCFLVSSWVS
jgi:TonB family protein